jgi:flavodoxin
MNAPRQARNEEAGMNIQAVYHTRTGHSRKIAGAIARALGLEAKDIKDWPEDGQADLLFIVGGIYGGRSDTKLLNFISRLKPGSVARAVLITSCASGKDGQAQVRQALEGQGVPVGKREFICPGNFLFFRRGRPNQKDLADAADFALRVAGKA